MEKTSVSVAVVLALSVLITPSSVDGDDFEDAEESPHSSYVMLEGGFFVRWNQFDAKGGRVGLGYDHSLFDGGWLTIGPRVGILEGIGTISTAGLRVLFWTGKPQESLFRFKYGLATDLWINLNEDGLQDILIYVGPEIGVRYTISTMLHIDFTSAIGLLPDISPVVYVFHLVTQFVVSF